MADVRISDLSLISAANLDDNDRLIVEQTSNGTGATKYSSLKEAMLGSSTITSLGGETVTQAIAKLNGVVNANDFRAHNSIARGVKLTSVDWATIGNGKFSNMYIGDYWEYNNIKWRIAAFNYYYGVGNTHRCETMHVVVVPDSVIVSSKPMNDTATATTGYRNSKMITANGGLKDALDILTASDCPFKGHILPVEQYVSSTVSGGTQSATWIDTSLTYAPKVIIMSERQVYGSQIAGNETIGTSDKGQFPLFAINHRHITCGAAYWLRDMHSERAFAQVTSSGVAYWADANATAGVRPAFCICQTVPNYS